MKSVLDKSQAIYYVDSSEITKFICQNSEMEWNFVCNFVKKHNITDNEYGKMFWDKNDLIMMPNQFNQEQLYWVGGFFEAHPWIEKMMIVFDS